MSDTLNCTLAGRCGGCSSHDQSIALGRDTKVERLRTLLGALVGEAALTPASLSTPATSRFRERLDLRLEQGRLGLLGIRREDGVIDMMTCPLTTEPLDAFLAELRADLPPVSRASLRLRAHRDLRGLWLDLSHVDIKHLLDERAWLLRWAPRVMLELGPKSRHVIVDNDSPKLTEPLLLPWAATFHGDTPLGLCSTVQGFSQPGSIPNRALVQAVIAGVRRAQPERIVELGAGAGNLSLPLVLDGFEVRAVELDMSAMKASIAHNRHHLGLAEQRLELVAGSFERETEVPALLSSADTLLCDPPRSGLGRFIDGLSKLSRGLRPNAIVYVSCHAEALARDAARLQTLGYRVSTLTGVDQFPFTHHAEWVVEMSR